ncbi:hypothetical protein HRbin40_01945 [bacterium HR40]|nr:hypothetical protein HRbin40_01945 [bacterium HR40]
MSEGKPGARAEEREPSMEEILSSIRRIIASDEEEAGSRTAAKPAVAQSEEGEDVLELTEVVAEEAGRQPEKGKPVEMLEAEAKAQLAETERRIEVVEAAAAPRAAVPEPAGLVSEATAQAATTAFARLARSVGQKESAASIPDSGRSVEQFVAELLRPMLKEWLDAHLPQIVERIVEQEVRKLAKRAELL